MDSSPRLVLTTSLLVWTILSIGAVLIGLGMAYVAPDSWWGQFLESPMEKVVFVAWVGVIVAVGRRLELRITGPRLARRLHDFWLDVSTTEGDIKPTAEFPSVFGVYMDWPEPGVVSTVVALADGTSSVFTTHGLAISGGMAAPEAAKELVREAMKQLAQASSVVEHPYPSPDTVRFYIRTNEGLRFIDEKTAALKTGTSRYTPLFAAGNRIMTELFQNAGLLPKQVPARGAA